jgi:hypothetical protein
LKYALSLSLTDPGFDFSVLSEFRTRLVEHSARDAIVGRPVGSMPEEWVACGRRTPAHGLHPCARAGPSAQPARPGGGNAASRTQCASP